MVARLTEHLQRRIGLGLLTAYGVGVMVGAGIYVLVGAVAAQAGVWAPLSFLIAGLIAAPTALSYAEFTTRLPEAAGEALFVEKGLNSRLLGIVVGLAIVAAGTVSAGAVLRGPAKSNDKNSHTLIWKNATIITLHQDVGDKAVQAPRVKHKLTASSS